MLIVVLALAGCTNEDNLAPSDSQRIVWLGAGDTFTYRDETRVGSETITASIQSSRPVLDAYGQLTEGAPVLWGREGPDSVVTFIDARHGGVALVASACLFIADMSCDTSNLPMILWPECAAVVGIFTPFTLIPRSALHAPTLTVAEPSRPLSWNYDVKWTGEQVEIRRDPNAETWETCRPHDYGVIDPVRGVLREVGNAGSRSVLESFRRSGEAFPMNAIPTTPGSISGKITSMDGPFPPGARNLSNGDFRLGRALEVAIEHSAEVGHFVRQHPNFVVATADTVGGQTVIAGIYTILQPGWQMTLMSPSGQAIAFQVRVTSRRPLPDEYTVTSVPPDPQDTTPTSFEAVGAQYNFLAFSERMESWFGPQHLRPYFRLERAPGGVAFTYYFPIDAASNSTFSTEWIGMDAGSGRITQATLNQESAKRFLFPTQHE